MNTLISTIEEFRAGVPVNVTSDIELLLPPVAAAERKHLVTLLGRAQYRELLDAYQASTLSTEQAELLKLVQVATANLAYSAYVTVAQLQMDNTGIRTSSDPNNRTAFQWQIDDLRAYLTETGYSALDEVLDYLDEHKADFPTWAQSAAYTYNKALLLNNAADFSRYYNINGSRRTFLALVAIIGREEVFTLEPVLSPAFCAALRAEIQTGTVSVATEAVLRLLHPALAHLTMSQAIGELSFSLNGGALELQVYRADNSNSKESDPGLTDLLSLKRTQALENGREYLRKLVTFLNANATATVYPDYFTSDRYVAPASAAHPLSQPLHRRRIYPAC
ncbi:MAG: DUF6712 family protein [Janthinobacterium lividum]